MIFILKWPNDTLSLYVTDEPLGNGAFWDIDMIDDPSAAEIRKVRVDTLLLDSSDDFQVSICQVDRLHSLFFHLFLVQPILA